MWCTHPRQNSRVMLWIECHQYTLSWLLRGLPDQKTCTTAQPHSGPQDIVIVLFIGATKSQLRSSVRYTDTTPFITPMDFSWWGCVMCVSHWNLHWFCVEWFFKLYFLFYHQSVFYLNTLCLWFSINTINVQLQKRTSQALGWIISQASVLIYLRMPLSSQFISFIKLSQVQNLLVTSWPYWLNAF